MKKTKLATVLKDLLQKQNLSESELARHTGVCQPVIHRMASGETGNPKLETLRPIAKYFSISLDQLIGDRPLPEHIIFHVEQELFDVPLITLQQALLWPNNKEQLSPLNFVQTDVMSSEAAYAIRLKDSTMYPMFPDGTLLIIDPKQPYSHRDFVIAAPKGHTQAIFKQLLIDGNRMFLKSVSSDFKTMNLTKHCKILGVMLQARIDFRKN